MTSRPSLVDRYANAIVTHRRLIIVLILLLTGVIGAGIIWLDGDITMSEFAVESEEREAMEYSDEHFNAVDHSVTLIVLSGDSVLSPESIDDSMGLQQALRENETVAATLADDRSTVGVGNVIAFATDETLTEEGYTIDDERAVLEGQSQEELIANLAEGIEIDDIVPGDRPSARTLLPADTGQSVGDSDARLILVVHDESIEADDLLAAQVAIDSITAAELSTTDAFVFGEELTFERGAEATAESFSFVGPFIVILLFVIMLLVFRNVLDVVLSMGGIGLVLIWTGGFLGWSGIGINQLLVAVPCLLVGLSIDHGFHVLMRNREAFRLTQDRRGAMSVALSGVIGAIALTTVTTMLGFLSSVWSPIRILREFGVVAAFGIVAAFVIFGVLLPAVKVEISQHLGGTLVDPDKPSLGVHQLIRKPLSLAGRSAQAIPVGVLLVSLLLLLGGVYGVSTVDTSTERTDFLPDGAPAWMESVPGDIMPGEYTLRQEALFVEETFDREEADSITILLRGDPTDPAMYESIAAAESVAIESQHLGERTDGRSIVYTPMTVIESLALHHPDVAEALSDVDTTGDGMPDQGTRAVLDAAFAVAPDEMGEVVQRNDDGTYEAARIVVTADGDAPASTVRWDMDNVAEAATSETVDAIATGGPILSEQQEFTVVRTTFATFIVALLFIAALLTLISRISHGSWWLGPITIAPVVCAVSWLLFVMAALSIPVNAESAIITGIAIGIGVDYSIHVSERFVSEYETSSVTTAMETTVVETGGTLLVSAITTMSGFGVLIFTFVPSLQRFGMLTALLVGFAFVASVVVLPALLTLWARYHQ